MNKTHTTPLILNGHEVSHAIRNKIQNNINELKKQNKRMPGLAVVLVGENPSSITYVKNKEKACKEIGIYSEVHKLETSIKETDLIKHINALNNNKNIDGIIVQLPLPIHIKQENIIKTVDPNKDVDGLHPINLGKLISGEKGFIPCTPLGVIEILKHYSINIEGMHVVVVGRSNLVGKPLSILLLSQNATVTTTHSKTNNLEEITKQADILISAIGKPKLIKRNFVKEDAIIIDVGINRIYENDLPKLVGDVDFESVKDICQAITPVPGGVGPVTVSMLLSNTLLAYNLNKS